MEAKELKMQKILKKQQDERQKLYKYKAEKNEEKQRKVMMAWENKKTELEQISISAMNSSMEDLRKRRQTDMNKEFEHQQQLYQIHRHNMSM